MKRTTKPPTPPPPAEGEPRPLAAPPHGAELWGGAAPTPPSGTPSERALESALRDRIWSGLASPPAAPMPGPGFPTRAPPEASPVPVAIPRELATDARAAWGSSPSASGQRQVAIPRAPAAVGAAEHTAEGMPLGYVVASGFFLAIAVVGFGLWLAFEVISL